MWQSRPYRPVGESKCEAGFLEAKIGYDMFVSKVLATRAQTNASVKDCRSYGFPKRERGKLIADKAGFFGRARLATKYKRKLH